MAFSACPLTAFAGTAFIPAGFASTIGSITRNADMLRPWRAVYVPTSTRRSVIGL